MRQPNTIAPQFSRTGFTLVELLITVGIIIALTALALPAILHARKIGVETRVRSDLGLINTAIEAYRGDFRGDYPRFSTPQEDFNAKLNSGADYPWLDYLNYRGAVLLCRALIGPGPGPLAAGGTTPPVEAAGEDGADGPGFRNRRLLSQINGVWVATGKVYGPYLDASKFKLISYPDYVNAQNPGSKLPQDPNTGAQMIADSNGNPILYYPAAVGSSNLSSASSNGTINYSVDGYRYYFNPFQYDPTNTYYNVTPARFNGYDNQAFLDSISGGSAYSTSSPFDTLAKNSGSLPYLLWTAGIDGKFGIVNGKTDDIANFDLPLAK